MSGDGQASNQALAGLTAEERFLSASAPTLTRARERFWLPPGSTGDVSYPTQVQARLAAVEEASFWFRHRNDVIHSAVERFAPDGPLLEIGGGNGYVAAGLAARGIPAIVVEPGREGAAIACRRGLTVVCGDLKPGLFRDGTVPAIGLFDVIEHVEDDVGFLSLCRQALAGPGHLFVSVPSLPALWSADDVYAGHFRRYTRPTLRAALAAAGFEVVALTYFFSPLVVPVFAMRTLPTLIGRRRVRDADDAFSHHGSPGGANILTSLLGPVLAYEGRLIAKGRAVPFGTSLLAVARRSVE